MNYSATTSQTLNPFRIVQSRFRCFHLSKGIAIRNRESVMRKRFTQASLVLVIALAAVQLIRPERSNPPTDSSRTIQAHVGTASTLVGVLDRSCGDCHSNRT